MLSFGQIYWIPKNIRRPYAEHFVVILGLDKTNKNVLFQSFTSQISHVFQFPDSKTRPHIDVDAVSFLDYQKYSSFLYKDTGVFMWYGVQKENMHSFEYLVKAGRYKYFGKIKKEHAENLLVSLRPATNYKLTPNDRALIMSHYKTL